MVNITNGKETFKVTTGAYRDVYSKQGWMVVDDKKVANDEKARPETEMTDDEFVEKLEEKPIAQWNKTEVKKYSQFYGIDISKTKNIEEARTIIRKFRSEAAEA